MNVDGYILRDAILTSSSSVITNMITIVRRNIELAKIQPTEAFHSLTSIFANHTYTPTHCPLCLSNRSAPKSQSSLEPHYHSASSAIKLQLFHNNFLYCCDCRKYLHSKDHKMIESDILCRYQPKK